MLSAGLRGIEEGYELPDEVQDKLHAASPEELATRGLGTLPGNLHDALERLAGSELVREALGEHVFEFFIRNKRQEWAEYKTQVSQFELDRYLPRL